MLLITGAYGQLGRCLADIVPAGKAYFLDADQLDITNAAAVQAFGAAHPLTGIINCAAYTNVDGAELELDLARRVNALGPAHLAQLAAVQNIPLVHISTDYVFDGTACQPLTPEAKTSPLGAYGQTKLEGEEAVLKYATTAVILRTAWLYSQYGKNFLKTMLKLGAEKEQIGVVADQIGTPTYAGHLAQAIVDILPQIKSGHKAVYHYTDNGVASWYDFAWVIMQKAGLHCRVNALTTAEYPVKAKRPSYSVLDKSTLVKTFNISLVHWIKGVELCLKKLS